MNEAATQADRKSLAELKQRSNPGRIRVDLTRDRLINWRHCRTSIAWSRWSTMRAWPFSARNPKAFKSLSARPDDEACRRRIVAGRFFDAPDQHAVVVSEFLVYRLGLVERRRCRGPDWQAVASRIPHAQSQVGAGNQLHELVGKHEPDRNVAVNQCGGPPAGGSRDRRPREADKPAAARPADRVPASSAAPEVRSEEFTVVGVIRKPTDDERRGPRDPLRVDSDVLLPYRTAVGPLLPRDRKRDPGINLAVLMSMPRKTSRRRVIRVAEMGLEPRAALEFIERERLIYVLIFGGMTCVAGVALLVSALGIANTMLMSVLERTREIGIMKAVGADNTHLQFIFLVEGGLIGLIGAGFGLLLAWAASYPGDAWVRSMVMRDIKIDLKSSIFVFPPWMAVTVLLFTVIVTTLAALYPARHAARIDPVSALRHE